MEKPNEIYVYDLRYMEKLDLANPNDAKKVWDECHLIAALQGLVNRESPKLYLLAIRNLENETNCIDEYWLNYLRKSGNWLDKTELIQIESLGEMITEFRSYFRGLVVYDPNVPATSNLASSIAGVDNLLPIRYDPDQDSLYTWLTQKMEIPIYFSFLQEDHSSAFTGKGKIPGTSLDSTGSTKADCYLWGIEKLIKTDFCNPTKLGYYLDSWWLKNPTASTVWNHTLTNHDYFISQQGFFFDLSPWDDENPNDDPAQIRGTDRATFQSLMEACNKQTRGKKMLHIGGFIPWAFKYTDYELVGGIHDGVQSEWEMVKLVSAYNGYIDADALGYSAMANASFYCHFPLDKVYPPEFQTPKERFR